MRGGSSPLRGTRARIRGGACLAHAQPSAGKQETCFLTAYLFFGEIF